MMWTCQGQCRWEPACQSWTCADIARSGNEACKDDSEVRTSPDYAPCCSCTILLMQQASASQYLKCEPHHACCAASYQPACLSSCMPHASTTSPWQRLTQQAVCICCWRPAAVLRQETACTYQANPQIPYQGAGPLGMLCIPAPLAACHTRQAPRFPCSTGFLSSP